MEKGSSDDLELLPCSFQFHDFHDTVGQVGLQCQFMKMDQSLYVWVGDDDENMKDLALGFAMQNQSKNSVLATKIMGPIDNEVSSDLARRLSKKSGKPVYVSFNLTVDNLNLPNIERRIYQEFQIHPELLAV